MQSSVLKRHAEALYSISMKPCMHATKPLQGLMQDITECLEKYSRHLDDQLKAQTERHLLLHPVCMLQDNVSAEVREAVAAPKPCNNVLDKAVKEAADDIYMHTHSITMHARSIAMYEKVGPHLPVFHTCAMKVLYSKQIGCCISHITLSVLESIYSMLAMESSAHSNPQVGERIRLILLGESGLVEDRELNSGRPSGKYDTFFEHLEDFIKRVIAVGDRWDGEAHLAHRVSLPDLIKQAAEKCPPPDTPTSSNLW